MLHPLLDDSNIANSLSILQLDSLQQSIWLVPLDLPLFRPCPASPALTCSEGHQKTRKRSRKNPRTCWLTNTVTTGRLSDRGTSLRVQGSVLPLCKYHLQPADTSSSSPPSSAVAHDANGPFSACRIRMAMVSAAALFLPSHTRTRHARSAATACACLISNQAIITSIASIMLRYGVQDKSPPRSSARSCGPWDRTRPSLSCKI